MAEIITLSSDDEDASAKGPPPKRKLQDDPPLVAKQPKLSNGVEGKEVTKPKVEAKSPATPKSVSHSNNVSTQEKNSPKKNGAQNGIAAMETTSPVASTSFSEPAEVSKDTDQSSKRAELLTLTPKKSVNIGPMDKTPPLLVIKRIEQVNEDLNQSAFSKYLESCRRKETSETMEMVLNKLQKRYDKLKEEDQVELSDLLVVKVNEISRRDAKVYVNIQSVNDAIKALLRKKNEVKEEVKEEEETKEPELEEPKKSVEESSQDKERRKKIRLIEKAMAKCEKKIKELGEAEVDFEEDDNSSYMKYERYKRRQVELFNELCKYTKDPTDAGRQYLKPKNISVTCMPQVNDAITSFVNSAISKRNNLLQKGQLPDVVLFPDHFDILKCIKHCNKEKNLGLDDRFIQTIAEKAFKDVGTYLQRLRREDYWDTFSIYLENADEDPAVEDKELADQLKLNKELGEKRLNDMFDEFAKRQEGLGADDDVASDDAENENEDEEEEEEDDNDDDLLDVATEKKTEVEKSKVDLIEEKSCEREETEPSRSSVQDNVESAKVDSNVTVETPIISEPCTSSISISKEVESETPEIIITIPKEAEVQSETPETPEIIITIPKEAEVQSETPETPEIIITIPKEAEVQSAAVSKDDENPDKTKDDGQALIRVRSFAKPPSSWTEKLPEVSSDPPQVPPKADSPEIIECKIQTPNPKSAPKARIRNRPIIVSCKNGKYSIAPSEGTSTTTRPPIQGPSKAGSSNSISETLFVRKGGKLVRLKTVKAVAVPEKRLIRPDMRPNLGPLNIRVQSSSVPENKLTRQDLRPNLGPVSIRMASSSVSSPAPSVQRPNAVPSESIRRIPPAVVRSAQYSPRPQTAPSQPHFNLPPGIQVTVRPAQRRVQNVTTLPLSTLPSNVQTIAFKQKGAQNQQKRSQEE